MYSGGLLITILLCFNPVNTPGNLGGDHPRGQTGRMEEYIQNSGGETG